MRAELGVKDPVMVDIKLEKILPLIIAKRVMTI